MRGIVNGASVIVFRYAACYKSPVEASCATNCSSRQALFVEGNHCPAIFGARHAFLPKKIEKVQYLQKRKVLSVVCGAYFPRSRRIRKIKEGTNTPLNCSVCF